MLPSSPSQKLPLLLAIIPRNVAECVRIALAKFVVLFFHLKIAATLLFCGRAQPRTSCIVRYCLCQNLISGFLLQLAHVFVVYADKSLEANHVLLDEMFTIFCPHLAGSVPVLSNTQQLRWANAR